MVTGCLKRAEGILGKESRGNGKVLGVPLYRNENEAEWVARVPQRGFFTVGPRQVPIP